MPDPFTCKYCSEKDICVLYQTDTQDSCKDYELNEPDWFESEHVEIKEIE